MLGCSRVVSQASVGIVLFERIGIPRIERILTDMVHNSESFIIDVLFINKFDRSVHWHSFQIQILTRRIRETIEIATLLICLEKLFISFTEEIIFKWACKTKFHEIS